MSHQYAVGVASRLVAAIVGGYFFSVISSFTFALVLTGLGNMALPDAVYLATMLSYFSYLFMIIWIFCKTTAWLAWRDLFLYSASLTALYFMLASTQGITQ